MIDYGIEGKTVLVTGGNNPYGIGAAVARAFAAQGAAVFIHYLRQAENADRAGGDSQDGGETGLAFFYRQQRKSADEVVASIRERGGTADSWECDLGEPDKAYELFERAERARGQIDILVNNAVDYQADTFLPVDTLKGGGDLWNGGPSTITFSPDGFDHHFSPNVKAAALLMAEFTARHIAEGREWGRIINVSAEHSQGCPGEISYTASKHALESYSRSAAAELGPLGITVNVVSPGPVQTGYIPMELEKELVGDISTRRIGTPQDIANAILFFASEQAGWITGQVLRVNGGHSLGRVAE
ncbi:MAG: SDR family oxidoreductase [Actinomycetota bacterium]|nr:SDR family oxidoreductase [Actinomycetota bacterium]